MARYGRDFARRGEGDDTAGEPLGASGPGAEGYYLSRDMAMEAERSYRDRPREIDGEGADPCESPGFGRARAGRGYGADPRPRRGGYDRGDYFVNRPGQGGYRPGGCERDAGMRGVPGHRGRGYRADDDSPGFAIGYDRGYRGGFGG